MKRVFIILGVLLTLSACGSSFQEAKPGFYNVTSIKPKVIQSRLLDAVNEARTEAGLEQVNLNSELEVAARKHSEDMSLQNRPWHWGSDGSSPIIRAQRTGYKGEFLGELISETYETEVETVNAWLENFDTQPILMDPRVTDVGFSWLQEANGKIWWTLLTGAQSTTVTGSLAGEVYVIGDSHAKAMGGINNLASNGARLSAIAKQANNVPNGATVYMTGGHNDVPVGTDPEKIARQVQSIISTLEGKGSRVNYILFPHGSKNTNQEQMGSTRQAITRTVTVTEDLEGCTLSDGIHCQMSSYTNIVNAHAG